MTAEAETPAAVPWRSRTVAVVLASTALAPLGVPLISPALPALRDAFGVTDAGASILVSGYFVVGIALSPLVGLLADRVGRKRVLVTGLLAFGLLGAGMAVAPTFEVVVALRVLQGAGAAAIFITTVTIVVDAFEGRQRRAVLGINVAVLSATAALFPVLGGALVGIAPRAPFLAYLAAVPVGLAAAVVLEEPGRGSPPPGPAYLRRALETVSRPAVLALFAATFLSEFLAFGVVFTALPFLLAPRMSPVAIGGVLLAAETAATVVAAASGRLAARHSSERLVALGFACYGVGFLASWVASASIAVAPALAVVGAGIGLLLPSVDSALSERLPAESRAGALSLRNSTTFAGRAAGPIAFVGLAGTWGYDGLLPAAGVVAAAAAVVAGLFGD